MKRYFICNDDLELYKINSYGYVIDKDYMMVDKDSIWYTFDSFNVSNMIKITNSCGWTIELNEVLLDNNFEEDEDYDYSSDISDIINSLSTDSLLKIMKDKQNYEMDKKNEHLIYTSYGTFSQFIEEVHKIKEIHYSELNKMLSNKCHAKFGNMVSQLICDNPKLYLK